MASKRMTWWRRALLRYYPWLFKTGPCGNIHWRWDRFCHCQVGEFSTDWNGGVWDFHLKREVPRWQLPGTKLATFDEVYTAGMFRDQTRRKERDEPTHEQAPGRPRFYADDDAVRELAESVARGEADAWHLHQLYKPDKTVPEQIACFFGFYQVFQDDAAFPDHWIVFTTRGQYALIRRRQLCGVPWKSRTAIASVEVRGHLWPVPALQAMAIADYAMRRGAPSVSPTSPRPPLDSWGDR